MLLLENQLEVDVTENNGYTSLMVACLHDHKDVATTLMNAKANFFLQKNQGTTTLDIALTDEIKQIIINHPWYRRRRLIVMHPHTDHISNEKYCMTAPGRLITAKEKGDGASPVLFNLN